MTGVSAMGTAGRHTAADRLSFHAAWALAAAVFLSVGWSAMRSWDPRGPISLLASAAPMTMMVEVLALATVMSAIATVLAGRRYPDAGAFAVGIALTLVSLRGDTMTYLLLERPGRATLCGSLIAEGLFWTVTMAAAMLFAAFIVRWIGPGPTLSDDGSAAERAPSCDVLARMAAPSIPAVGRWLLGGSESRQPSEDRVTRIKHLAVVVVVALVLTRVFVEGTPAKAIRHGQACFAVFAGFYLAAGRAQTMFPVRSVLWTWLAVPIVCAAAYGFAGLMSLGDSPGRLASVPQSGFLRVLPIDYVALGTSTVLLARWRSIVPTQEQSSRLARSGGRR